MPLNPDIDQSAGGRGAGGAGFVNLASSAGAFASTCDHLNV